MGPNFDYNLPQIRTFNSARFKPNLFGGSAEILSYKFVNKSKVERLQKNTTLRLYEILLIIWYA